MARVFLRLVPAIFCLSLVGLPARAADETYFTPAHKLAGIGVGRRDLTAAGLRQRTQLMIEAQTFGIVRDVRSLAGARKILSPPMMKLFEEASRQSGLPWSVIAAVAYLESFGDSNAQSPAGPRGIMQIASGTAQSMGLRMVYQTRYRTVTERRTTRTKRGKPVTRMVRRRLPYTVLVRDERLMPERAIPAAANYLARLEKRFDGLDWAIFAYHCGEGCVASMRSLTENARGLEAPFTVPKMFFGADPSFNRELYQAVLREMKRDWSPTYYFRVMCAERLLGMYRANPQAFERLVEEHRWELDPEHRAPHRLSVWLKSADLERCEVNEREPIRGMKSLFGDEESFGFKLRNESEDPDYYLRTAPSTVGTLAYIAYETRRLYLAMRSKERFVPLEVTSLAQPVSFSRASANGKDHAVWHCTGRVFDIDYRTLPLAEREALDFVLEDIGNMGYLGFIEEVRGGSSMHIGCSPSSQDFFSQVFDDAMKGAPKQGN